MAGRVLDTFVTSGSFDDLEVQSDEDGTTIMICSGSSYILQQAARQVQRLSTADTSANEIVQEVYTRYDDDESELNTKLRDALRGKLNDIETPDESPLNYFQKDTFHAVVLGTGKLQQSGRDDGVGCAVRIVAVLQGYGCDASIANVAGKTASAYATESLAEAEEYASESGDSMTSFLDESAPSVAVADTLSMRSIAL